MNYGLINSRRGVLRLMKTQIIFLTTVLWTLGCMGKPPCKEPFTKTIVPIKVQDKQELQFDIDEFGFLLDPTYIIEDMQLEGDIVLHKSRKEDFAFSLNGVKSCRSDNEDAIEIDCGSKNKTDKDKSKDHTERHRFCTKAHKFSLNGGISILEFITKIHTNKGQLKIKLHGRDHEVSNVKIVVKGTHYVKCAPPTNPPPPPPPKPVAPHTTINGVDPQVSPTSVTSKSISFAADQSGVTYYCSLDSAAASPCTSPKAYADLGNGPHSFAVYATNAAGLSDVAPATHSWVVDSVAPSVTIDNISELKSSTSSDSIAFVFSSNDPDSTYSCSIDNKPAGNCSSPQSYTALAEGAHSFSVTSVDSVGNVSPAPATFMWTIDKTAPVSSVLAATPSSAVNNSPSMSLEFAANESSTFECAIDNGGFQTCASPFVFSNLGEGSHTVEVRATDLVGNQGLSASYNWRTDLTAPIIHIGNVLPAQGLTAAPDIVVEFALSEVANAQCSFDGQAAVACESPFQVSVSAPGAHSLMISAGDLAGNQAAPQILSWEMDFTLPEISFGAILPSTASFINVNNFSAEVVSSKQMELSARLNGQDLGVVSSPITLNNLSEGAYTLEVSGRDAVGNIANTISHGFTVDMTAPTVVLASEVVGTTRLDSNMLTFSSNDGSQTQCNVDNAGFEACISPMALSGLAEGQHDFQVRAIDMAGNIGEVLSAQWSVDTVAPLTSLIATQLSPNSFSFSLMASEEGSQFSCSLDGAPATPCSTPVVYGNLSPGNHSFAAWAVDSAGNMDPTGASHGFGIVAPISTTLVSATPSDPFTNSPNIVFAFTANQSNATFQCSLNGAAPTPCVSPMSYTELNEGQYTFKVQAIDVFGNIDAVGASHAWIVDLTAPVMVTVSTSVTSTTITVNWTTSEPSTSKLLWGKDFLVDKVVAEDNVYKTSHSVKLTGLSSNSVYSLQPGGTDRAGNAFIANRFTARTSR